MKNKTNGQLVPERLGRVGGQAVLEGVMMKSGEEVCLAVRNEDGGIKKKRSRFVSLRRKHKICNLPIIRGVINFVEMMSLSMGTLTDSADLLGVTDAEAESKFEIWLKEHLGDRLMSVIMAIATVIGVVLSIGLFILIPTAVTKGLAHLAGRDLNWLLRSAVEGVLKIGIFILYIALVSLMPDIRRTFEYHGAEHKSVACYEHGLDLTPENAATCTRFHPRCGTSFIFVMLIISIIISMFIRIDSALPRTLVKLLLLPLSVGIGFEFIMYAGKHDNAVTHALSAPGLWMQRLTTKEPDESQLEVAIAALKGAIPSEFPTEDDDDGESCGNDLSARDDADGEDAPGVNDTDGGCDGADAASESCTAGETAHDGATDCGSVGDDA